MGADKGKKQKLPEKAEIEISNEEPIDGELVLSIEKLQEIQDELEKINEEASEKVLEVEQKYNVVRKPIYDKRNGIIKSIPDFWLTAFTSHPALGELLTDEDHQIFKYLKSIEVEDSPDVKLGYTITFNFNPNPYFEDTKLTKAFAFLDEGTAKITGTAIRWKEGMGIPNGVVSVKNGNKRSNPEESFFTWFGDEGDMEELHEEVADIIKDDLWPNPLTYFNADADEEEFDEEGNVEETDDDEDDDDDDDENGEDD